MAQAVLARQRQHRRTRCDAGRGRGVNPAAPGATIGVVLKGYPRLSETFIAQEVLGLEKAGFELELVAMRRPTDKKRHPVHDEIRAPVHYLPEYLHEEPFRVLKALWKTCRLATRKRSCAGRSRPMPLPR